MTKPNKARTPSLRFGRWDSSPFSSIFLASSFSCSQALSTPAHLPVPRRSMRGLRKPLGRPCKIRLIRPNEKENEQCKNFSVSLQDGQPHSNNKVVLERCFWSR